MAQLAEGRVKGVHSRHGTLSSPLPEPVFNALRIGLGDVNVCLGALRNARDRGPFTDPLGLLTLAAKAVRKCPEVCGQGLDGQKARRKTGENNKALVCASL